MAFQSAGMPMLGSEFGETPSGQPSLQFSVPCLEVTNEDGRPPSLKYLFYDLPLPEFPYPVTFFIANGWCNGKGNFAQRLKILGSDRSSALVETGRQDFSLKEIAEPFMAVNELKQITFPKEGTYWCQIFLGDRKMLEYPITVSKAKKKK